MSKQIESIGTYNVPAGMQNAGSTIEYPFAYPQFDSLQDAINELGEGAVLANVQRMVKVDANNTSREKAKRENGHSTTKLMTEEEKANAKAERAQNKKLLELLKSKGIKSLDELASIL